MQVYSLTNPYAVLLSFSSVISATYANITEKVTEKSPDTEIRAKYHLERDTETILVTGNKYYLFFEV